MPSKTHEARITKLDKDVVHHELWKSIYSEVKRSREVKHCQHGSWYSCVCWLLLFIKMMTAAHQQCPQ